jgi:hypothetical protein
MSTSSTAATENTQNVANQNEIPSQTETSTTSTTSTQNSRPDNGRNNVVRTPGLQRVPTVATRLVTNGEAFELSNNTHTRLRTTILLPDRLLATFQDILSPLVHGNLRSLGVNSTNADSPKEIEEILYTTAVNAVQAAYAVAYNKATRGNYGVSNSFGGLPEADHFRFPSLLTALINSLGPVTRDTEPYQANFIPVLVHSTTVALINNLKYKPHRFEQFLAGLQRARTISFADVDVNTQESSPWWMLHITKTETERFTGNRTVYNPIPFDERDPCTILAGLVINQTLYALPGPLRTQVIGPFLANENPSFSDIPKSILNGTAFNRSPFAYDYVFSQAETAVSTAEAYVLFGLQGDPTSAAAVEPFISTRARSDIEDHIDQNYTSKSSTGSTNALAVTNPDQTTKRARTDVSLNVNNANDPSVRFSNTRVTLCTIMWFNHIMYSNFNQRRISGIIIEACRSDNP